MKKNKFFPPKNSSVRVFFHNGNRLEGIVGFWDKNKALLLSPDSPNEMLIYHPEKNVLMVELLYEVPSQEETTTPASEEVRISAPQIRTPVSRPTSSLPTQMDKRIEALLARQQRQSTNEKQFVAQQLNADLLKINRSLPPTQTGAEHYESPDFSKYQPPRGSR